MEDGSTIYFPQNVAKVEDPIELDFRLSGTTLLGAVRVEANAMLLNLAMGHTNGGTTNPVTELDLKKRRCLIRVDDTKHKPGKPLQMCPVIAASICFYQVVDLSKKDDINKGDKSFQSKVTRDTFMAIAHVPDKPMTYADLHKLALIT